MVGVQVHSFACGYSVVQIPFVEMTSFTAFHCLGAFLKIRKCKGLFSVESFLYTVGSDNFKL